MSHLTSGGNLKPTCEACSWAALGGRLVPLLPVGCPGSFRGPGDDEIRPLRSLLRGDPRPSRPLSFFPSGGELTNRGWLRLLSREAPLSFGSQYSSLAAE